MRGDRLVDAPRASSEASWQAKRLSTELRQDFLENKPAALLLEAVPAFLRSSFGMNDRADHEGVEVETEAPDHMVREPVRDDLLTDFEFRLSHN